MKNNTKHRRYIIRAWRSDVIDTWVGRLYVAGNFDAAEMVCRKHVFPQGICVSIQKTKYILAGGTEDGVSVTLYQYPPFPENTKILLQKLKNLGKEIAEVNYQWSFSILDNKQTYFYSRRRK